mmetsp:Transcript_11592/g.25541  ORF Transcript_11592/g.25541 Transcript_11592/m.25541 type:complete len:275 (+) Transcript_11592:1294-2118(+)
MNLPSSSNISIVGIRCFTESEINGMLFGSCPSNELPAQYARTNNNAPKMTSANNSPAAPVRPPPPVTIPPSPMINDGKNNAISIKIACCMLNRISLFKEGLPDRKFKAKNAANPLNGILLYNPYSNAKMTMKGFASAPSALNKNRPYCNPSINGNKYGRIEMIFSVPVGCFSFKNSNFASANNANSFSFLDALAASSARRFSSRARASSWLRNLSTVTNSSSWRAPSPDLSNTSINSFTLFSEISVFNSFSSPIFNSLKLTSPSSLISNLLNAF